MKKIILCAVFLVLTFSGFAQKPNTIVTGKIDKFPAKDWIYIRGFQSGYMDSIQQNKKGFKFELNIPEGQGDFYILSTGRNAHREEGGSLFLYLEKGKIKILSSTENFKGARFTGGNLGTAYSLYTNRPQVKGAKEFYKEMSAVQNSKDQAKIATMMKRYNEIIAGQNVMDKKFVLQHKNNITAVYPLYFNLRDFKNINEIESLLDAVAPSVKNNLPIKSMLKTIRTEKLTGVGKTALPFTQNDVNGKPVSLADFKGKYVLVDFWASWCVPCRIENPNVVSAFEQFKNKNFTVLGVSFDNPGQQQNWINAIKEDNLNWTQVSDLKGWKNEVGVLYDIKSIPANLLIDPNGVIVAKNLKGDKLSEKLRELLGEPKMDEGKFVINGKVTNELNHNWVQIYYQNEKGESISDSTRIYNGAFSYVGKVKNPIQATLRFIKQNEAENSYEANYTSFFLEPGITKISGDSKSSKDLVFEGGKVQEEWKAFEKLTEKERSLMEPLSKSYDEKSRAYGKAKQAGESEEVLNKLLEEATQAREKLGPYSETITKKQLEYIKTNPNSWVSASYLRYFVSALSLTELETIYSQMDETLKNSVLGKELAQEIAEVKSGSPGSLATNFKDIDINGKSLQLTDFRGKYVLLDFWASWCVPCRAGNPHLLDLYSKYNKKGFEIIGISDDDRNEKAWKKAVNDDKIHIWKHVLRGLKSDGKGGFDKSQDKSANYGIHTLPTKILIDPNGIIIGRFGSGGGTDEDLDKQLKTIFKI